MICYICESSNWLRPTVLKDGKRVPIHSEMTTQICKNCGSACHEVDPASEEKVKEFYRKDYRPQPTTVNLITTTHKLNYVRVFLRDFLKERQGKQLIVGDVGAATGYLLNFFKQLGHRVTGSELTVTYRRMSEHYYGIPLAEELEPKHAYDLICVYHVLEHLVEPDKKLAHYASLLAPGGHMLIATPEWFDVIEEAAGVQIQGFDHLFHKNHINLFSKASIRNLFRKCGLTVVKEDYVQYGQTYLLRKDDSPRVEGWLQKEDAREVERVMLAHYRALELHMQGRFRDAYEVWPRFPEAWLMQAMTRCVKDQAKQMDLMAEADKVIGDNLRYVLQRGLWNYQQGRLAEAIRDYQTTLAVKPNEDTLMWLGMALAQAGRPLEAIQCMQNAQAMDPRKWQEANTWILSQVSQMPAWDEPGGLATRAAAEAKRKDKPEPAPEPAAT